MHDCDFCNQWSLTVKHEDGARICASCCDEEYTSKLEVSNAALVEALEKAQDSGKIYQQSFFRQSLMFDVVAEAYEEAKQRIAELESKKPDIYLCRVIRNGEELHSRCGADYPRGTGYHRSAPVESRTVAAESFTCPRCGRTTTHPEGWHYCHKREAD